MLGRKPSVRVTNKHTRGLTVFRKAHPPLGILQHRGLLFRVRHRLGNSKAIARFLLTALPCLLEWQASPPDSSGRRYAARTGIQAQMPGPSNAAVFVTRTTVSRFVDRPDWRDALRQSGYDSFSPVVRSSRDSLVG